MKGYMDKIENNNQNNNNNNNQQQQQQQNQHHHQQHHQNQNQNQNQNHNFINNNLMNLDEFLIENGVDFNYINAIGEESKLEVEFSPLDIALATRPGSDANFDPSSARFSEDELRPQPIMRKSRKQHVPDTLKDARYWARRVKNNMAAKRSREARRLKENQIVLRASYLEKENESLRVTLEKLRQENDNLKKMIDSD